MTILFPIFSNYNQREAAAISRLSPREILDRETGGRGPRLEKMSGGHFLAGRLHGRPQGRWDSASSTDRRAIRDLSKRELGQVLKA